MNDTRSTVTAEMLALSSLIWPKTAIKVGDKNPLAKVLLGKYSRYMQQICFEVAPRSGGRTDRGGLSLTVTILRSRPPAPSAYLWPITPATALSLLLPMPTAATSFAKDAKPRKKSMYFPTNCSPTANWSIRRRVLAPRAITACPITSSAPTISTHANTLTCKQQHKNGLIRQSPKPLMYLLTFPSKSSKTYTCMPMSRGSRVAPRSGLTRSLPGCAGQGRGSGEHGLPFYP